MNHILTLICNPHTAILNDEAQARAAACLNELGAETKEANWLAHGIACDIPFRGLGLKVAASALQDIFHSLPIDIIAQKSSNRRKKLLVADMDSTMIIGETLDDLAEFAGYKDEVSAITRRAMNGELLFVDALKQRVKLLEGLSLNNLKKAMSAVKLMPGGKTLVQTMKANGAPTILISGGFTFFTDRVRDLIGFDEAKGNNFEIRDAKLTGQVLEPIIDSEAKLLNLRNFANEYQVNKTDILAVGDGANDLPMLLEAGMGVAYHAKPAVSKRARVGINHGDLTALLYIQGFRIEEFII